MVSFIIKVEMARVPPFIMITVQTLYESSIAFGIRKALQAEQGKTDMENYIAKLEEEKVIRSIVNI